MQEHDYAKHSVYYDETLLMPRYKGNAQDIWHSKLGPCQPESNDVQENASKTNWSLFSTDKFEDLLSLLSQSSDEIISVKLPKYEKTDVIGGSNYVDVVQGSSEWFANRIGVITASKLPTLLGMNGHKELDAAWFCINKQAGWKHLSAKEIQTF